MDFRSAFFSRSQFFSAFDSRLFSLQIKQKQCPMVQFGTRKRMMPRYTLSWRSCRQSSLDRNTRQVNSHRCQQHPTIMCLLARIRIVDRFRIQSWWRKRNGYLPTRTCVSHLTVGYYLGTFSYLCIKSVDRRLLFTYSYLCLKSVDRPSVNHVVWNTSRFTSRFETMRCSVLVIWAGILKQSIGARNRVGIGLSYRSARLHRLAEFIPWNRFLTP